MCGIVGLAGARVGSDTLPALRRALNRLEHRGPDDAGMLVWAPGEGPARLLDATGHATPLPHTASGRGGLVLGHRRLAIIDPSPAGHQPMATPDGRYVLVLNGEIYNYLELRQELETRGSSSAPTPIPRCCCRPGRHGDPPAFPGSPECSRS